MSVTTLSPVRTQSTGTSQKARGLDMKLEVAVIPVADIERAKQFYEKLGWRLDADFIKSDGSRAVQLTPPGSPSSIHLGAKAVLFLVVSDIDAARAELSANGAAASGVFHLGKDGPISGPDPERRTYSSFVSFSDPDGNDWLVQEVTTRLPGRVDTDVTSFTSTSDLEAALIRAATAHGEHEKRHGGERDENWPAWYAEYMVAEQAGKPLPE